MKRNVIVKNCLYCNDTYNTQREDSKYCNNSCRTQAQRTTLNIQRKRITCNCLNCNLKFEKHNYSNQKFCSKQCGFEHQRKNSVKRDESELNKIDKCCIHCGKSFRVWKYRSDAQFCSHKCKHLHSHIKSNCSICGKEYTTAAWKNLGFCSTKCKNCFKGKRKSKFETLVFEYLESNKEENNIESNKIIYLENKKLFPDITINDKIIIECFGDYWHCNPNFYKYDYYHSKIRKTAKEIWETDNLRVETFKKYGYTVLILWEHDIMNKIITLENIKDKIYEICKNTIN